jgi:hypothetical protein
VPLSEGSRTVVKRRRGYYYQTDIQHNTRLMRHVTRWSGDLS